MARFEFLAALYNETAEIDSLIKHVVDYVDAFNFADDGSTDGTSGILQTYQELSISTPFRVKTLEHTGLPETVKNEALGLVTPGSWVLMLDADERFAPGVLEDVRAFVDSYEERFLDYIYFNQIEVIDGVSVRQFQKAKLFRKENVLFPLNNIHADDQFIGSGEYRPGWTVFHRKTTSKQIQRETEYLQTYRKLLNEGHIDEGRERWLQGLHHYVKPKG